MESFRGLSDEELLEKLQSRRGPLGPPRKLYEKKFYEFETRRWRRGGADDPDNDRAPQDFGEGSRAWQPVRGGANPNPSPARGQHEDSPIRLEPRQPLRAPPGPPWSPAGPPECPQSPSGRLLPLRPQLVALGLIAGVLLGLLLLGGSPG